MLVLPADHWIDPTRTSFREVLEAAARIGSRRRVRHRGAARHARRPGRPAGHRVRLPHARHDARRRRSTASRPTRCSGSRRSRPTRGRGELYHAAGRRLERRDLPVAAPGDPRRDRAVHAADHDDRAGGRLASSASQAAYDRLKPISIDHAVMEGAASRPPGRDGRDGRRLERPRQLDRSSSRRCRRRRDAGTGRVVQPSEPVEVGPDDLVVERVGRAARRRARRRRAVLLADEPRGPTSPGAPRTSSRVAGARSTASPRGGPPVTNIAEAPAPTTIVFGTDGWRAQIADDYTFENVRRCADGVARYVVGRGEQAKGVVIAYDRRFASEHFAAAAAEVLLAHDIPVAFAVARRADPDELVRGRRARRGRRHRHHRQPQPLDRQRLQGQGADRVRGRPGHARGHRGGDRGERRRRDRAPAVRRRRGGRPGRAVRPVRGLRALRPPDGRPRRAEGGRHRRPRRADVGRRRGLAPAAARRRPDPGHRDPPGAQPVLRRRQPGADPAERRRGARR